MTADDFKRAWEQDHFKLVTFAPEAVVSLRVPEAHRAFLIQPGLPESAAPYLDFGGKHHFGIPSVADLWKAGEAFRRYRTIGANGFGDPICLDEEADGAVVYLNHDDGMRRCFMNSNVQCLASSLLAFREVVRETQQRGGTGAWLAGKIPSDVVDRFILRMDEIDPPAIKADTFWFRSVLGEGT
jgi:SUKH-4 immunity protein